MTDQLRQATVQVAENFRQEVEYLKSSSIDKEQKARCFICVDLCQSVGHNSSTVIFVRLLDGIR